MKKSFVTTLVFLLSLTAFAGNKIDKKAAQRFITVECSVTVKGKKEAITFHLNNNKQIVYYKDNQVAKTSKDSLFWPLGENLEEAGVESLRTFFTPNGYSVVYAITTADAVKVGISRNLNAGFYEYSDLGSGNGNKKLNLICEQK